MFVKFQRKRTYDVVTGKLRQGKEVRIIKNNLPPVKMIISTFFKFKIHENLWKAKRN